MVTWKPVKLTAMHHQHLSLGATMVDYLGWQRPARYTSTEEELESVRVAGGFCDVSPLGKFYVQGRDVGGLLQRAFPEAASPLSGLRLRTGRLVVCRFADDEAFITCSPDEADQVSQVIEKYLSGCAHVVDMTSSYAAVNLLGPSSNQLLARLTDLNVSPSRFPDLSCAQGQVAEIYAIIVRCDLGGLLSYDAYFGRDFGEYMWEAILEAGRELGIAPVGVEALKQIASGG